MIDSESWMGVREAGVYCIPADCYLDPIMPVSRAVITHGHADHARKGHGTVWATPETIDIMGARYYIDEETTPVPLRYGQRYDLGGGVTLWFASAGHILGSAQAVFEYQGQRIGPAATNPAMHSGSRAFTGFGGTSLQRRRTD